MTGPEQDAPPPTPVAPMRIAGYGRIRHAALPPDHQTALTATMAAAVRPRPVPETWGVLFVTDGADRRLSLYSHDPDYVSLLNEAATPIPGDVFHDKFFFFRIGWDLVPDDLPTD